jgi:hypothetical protein
MHWMRHSGVAVAGLFAFLILKSKRSWGYVRCKSTKAARSHGGGMTCCNRQNLVSIGMGGLTGGSSTCLWDGDDGIPFVLP